MTQTVSIQRGSVTFTANGASAANITTLFTNTSSGNGTRVIVNYIMLTNPYVSNGSANVTTMRNKGFLGVLASGGSGSTIIGYMNNSANTQMTTAMPIQDAGIAYGSGYTLPLYAGGSPSVNEVGFSNIRPNSVNVTVNSGTQYGFCPRNFWIGPSDVLKWWPQDSFYEVPSGKSTIRTYVTQTLYYSFTCITES